MELAFELCQLQDNRPEKPSIGSYTDFGSPAYKSKRDRHWSHMMTEHDIKQEIYGRIGRENGDIAIEKARNTLKLMS